MSFRPVGLPEGVPGSLWLTSMPGRFGSLASFEQQAAQAHVALVVCLTPRSEVRELSPTYDAAIEGPCAWQWLNLPMPNFGVPEDPKAFREGIASITRRLREGESVVLHCAAGIGRTGSTAACVLKALGLSTGDAIEQVREAGSNPENAKQSGFVDWF